MRYVGGKSRHAKQILDRIDDYRTTQTILIEPFCGGGAITKEAVKRYDKVYAFDNHPDLIMMYQALQAGWQPPSEVTEDEYQVLKYSKPSALRGFVGFGCSFGGIWFGKYALNSYPSALHESIRSVGFNKSNMIYENKSFFDVNFDLYSAKDCVVYCDPPYINTTGYSTGIFNHDLFWSTCSKLHNQEFLVFISEYTAPSYYKEVFSKSVGLQLSGGTQANARTERLFTLADKPVYAMF